MNKRITKKEKATYDRKEWNRALAEGRVYTYRRKTLLGRWFFDKIIDGKKHKRQLLLEARERAGDGGIVRYQTIGAKGRARYPVIDKGLYLSSEIVWL